MSFTDKISVTFAGGDLNSNQQVTKTASGRATVSENVPQSATTQLSIAFPIATIVSVLIRSDQDVTLKTNSSGAPVNTIAVTGGVPQVWWTGQGTCPFTTTDVSTIYVVAGAIGSDGANVDISVLYDTTP